MKKKTITKSLIMRIYAETMKPIGKTHFERMIDWFEFNDYNLTSNAINNIRKYVKVRIQIDNELNGLFNK